MNAADPDLLQLVRRIRLALSRHRRRSILFFVGTMVLVTIGLIFCPRKYQSEAKLYVRVGRESISLDPTATTGAVFDVQENREHEINSVLDLMSSPRISEHVVDTIGVDKILGTRTKSTHVTQVAETANVPSDSTVSPANRQNWRPDQSTGMKKREKAILHLSKTIKTVHSKKSNVITLTCKARSPRDAQTILTTFVSAFLEQHLRAHRTSGSYKVFGEQADVLRDRLVDATAQLRDTKNELSAVSVERMHTNLQDQMNQVELEIVGTNAALTASESTIASLRETIAGLPERLVIQEVTGFPNDVINLSRKQLYDLENREQELLTKYTEHHPLVISIRSQIVQARRNMSQEQTPSSQATNAKNPAYEQLRLKMLSEEAIATSLRAESEFLEGQRTKLQQELRFVNEQEGQIAHLQQQVDLQRAKHASCSEKLKQARIDRALLSEHISDVNVVQPPTYVLKPVSPEKTLMVGLALILGTNGGISLALLTEVLNETTQQSHEVATAVDGPGGHISHGTSSELRPKTAEVSEYLTERIVVQVAGGGSAEDPFDGIENVSEMAEHTTF